MSIDKNKDILNNIKTFQDNWNGYGAHSFSDVLIDKLIVLLDSLEIQPNIGATSRDSILFEYKINSRVLIVFEFYIDRMETFVIENDRYRETSTNYVWKDYPDKINRTVRRYVPDSVGQVKHVVSKNIIRDPLTGSYKVVTDEQNEKQKKKAERLGLSWYV